MFQQRQKFYPSVPNRILLFTKNPGNLVAANINILNEHTTEPIALNIHNQTWIHSIHCLRWNFNPKVYWLDWLINFTQTVDLQMSQFKCDTKANLSFISLSCLVSLKYQSLISPSSSVWYFWINSKQNLIIAVIFHKSNMFYDAFSLFSYCKNYRAIINLSSFSKTIVYRLAFWWYSLESLVWFW